MKVKGYEIVPGANLQEANLRGANLQEANLERANLERANLLEANLRRANLKKANLRGAILLGANLLGANLRKADLKKANLRGANLQEADLLGANLLGVTLPTGESWENYLLQVVPALLTAGGKDLKVVSAAWDCHDWTNCPIAVAFSTENIRGVPILLHPRAEQFIQFFDARLIPKPI